jgi:hypothetical protein
VRIVSSCSAASCLASRSDSYVAPTIVRWSNDLSMPQTVFVAVSNIESYSSGQTFDLTATLSTLPANADCANATDLTASVSVNGRFEDGRQLATTCTSAAQPSLYYAVNVPAGQRVVVTATNTTSASYTYRPIVRILAACGAASCIGRVSGNIATWTNTGSTAQRVLVAVSGDTTTTNTQFSVVATFETPATNGTCSAAQSVTLPANLTNLRSDDAVELAPVCDIYSSMSAPSLFYSVSVPAGHRLTTQASSTSSSIRTASILDGCGGACLTRASTSRSSVWTNADTSPRTVIVAVPVSPSATETLSATFSSAAVPTGGLCRTPIVLAPGTSSTVTNSLTGEAVPLCSGSSSSLLAPAAFYSIPVPAGRTVRVALSGVSVSSAYLRAFADCSSLATCAAFGVRDSTSGETYLTWTNGASTMQNLIAASGWTSQDYYSSSYTISAALLP